MPAWRCSTASSIARRSRSRPTERRRGLGPPASTSACTSTSSGRVPSSVTSTHEPGTGSPCVDRKIALGLADALQALLGHREDADLVDRAEAVLDRAHEAKARVRVALEVEHRVDDVLEHARAGERAVLGDVADQDDRRAARLGQRASAAPRTRAPARPSRAPSVQRLAVDGLDRVDHRRPPAARPRASPGSSRAGSRPARAPRRRAEAEPARAQRHLRAALLAGDVEHLASARDSASSACSSSVDLPMPGSPPISTTPPATMPPPSTRSNSSMPVGWRSASVASISASVATASAGSRPRAGVA